MAIFATRTVANDATRPIGYGRPMLVQMLTSSGTGIYPVLALALFGGLGFLVFAILRASGRMAPNPGWIVVPWLIGGAALISAIPTMSGLMQEAAASASDELQATKFAEGLMVGILLPLFGHLLTALISVFGAWVLAIAMALNPGPNPRASGDEALAPALVLGIGLFTAVFYPSAGILAALVGGAIALGASRNARAAEDAAPPVVGDGRLTLLGLGMLAAIASLAAALAYYRYELFVAVRSIEESSRANFLETQLAATYDLAWPFGVVTIAILIAGLLTLRTTKRPSRRVMGAVIVGTLSYLAISVWGDQATADAMTQLAP